MKTLRPDLTAKGWTWADVERMNIKPGVFQKLGAKSPANLAKLGRYGLRGARWLLDPIELLLAAPITAYEGYQGYKQKMTDVESYLGQRAGAGQDFWLPEKHKPAILELMRKRALGTSDEGALAYEPKADTYEFEKLLGKDKDDFLNFVDWQVGQEVSGPREQREYETAERCGILKINGELSYKVGGRFIKIFPDFDVV